MNYRYNNEATYSPMHRSLGIAPLPRRQTNRLDVSSLRHWRGLS